MSNKVILALDVSSSSTGYAILRNGRWRLSGSSCGTICIPPKLHISERLVLFRDELEKLINKVKPDLIVVEDIFFLRSISTVKLLARLNGVALEIARRKTKKEPLLIHTSSVRAYLECGKSKEEAFDYICERYKLKHWDLKSYNDITDAVCLALYAHAHSKDIL